MVFLHYLHHFYDFGTIKLHERTFLYTGNPITWMMFSNSLTWNHYLTDSQTSVCVQISFMFKQWTFTLFRAFPSNQSKWLKSDITDITSAFCRENQRESISLLLISLLFIKCSACDVWGLDRWSFWAALGCAGALDCMDGCVGLGEERLTLENPPLGTRVLPLLRACWTGGTLCGG